MKIYGLTIAALFLAVGSWFLTWNDKDQGEAPYRLPLVSPADIEKDIAFHLRRVERNPEGGLDYATLAALHLKNGNPEEAEALARRSLKNLPYGNEGAWLVLAELAEQKHEFNEAVRIANRVLESDPGNAKAKAILVTTQLGMGETMKAARVAEDLVRSIPSLGSLTLLALTLEAQGKDDEAVVAYRNAIRREELGQRETSAWARYLLGRLHLKHGRLDRARSVTKEALRIWPEYHLALGQLGRIDNSLLHFIRAHEVSGEPIYLLEAFRVSGRKEYLERAEEIVTAEVKESPFGHRTELAEIILERGGDGALPLVAADAKIRRDEKTLTILARAHEAEAAKLRSEITKRYGPELR